MNFSRRLVINSLLFFSSIIFFSCSGLTGEEVGRIAINQVSTPEKILTKQIRVDLKKGDEIAFWSEMDMEYEGQVGLRFRVKILHDGKEYTSLEIDPANKNITIGEFKSTIKDKTKWRFKGRNTKIRIKEDGTYTFVSQLIASENSTLKINKAELVLKK